MSAKHPWSKNVCTRSKALKTATPKQSSPRKRMSDMFPLFCQATSFSLTKQPTRMKLQNYNKACQSRLRQRVKLLRNQPRCLYQTLANRCQTPPSQQRNRECGCNDG
eukprot:10037_5